MKPIKISRDIVPLAQLKTRASQILRQMHEDERPVVVTQNGRPAAVMLTPEAYDQLQDRERFLAAVREGLDDAEDGRLVDDADLEAELEAEFGA